MIDYSFASSGVTVDLADTTITAGGGQGVDTISGIEGVQGSQFGDLLTLASAGGQAIGGAGNDTLVGLGGEDFLFGGAGNDTLTGGGGDDIAGYFDATGSVTVNLDLGTATGSAGNDTLSGIENVFGGEFNDVLVGEDGFNSLDGGDGDDRLFGRGGNDLLGGGVGNDTIFGGDANDTLEGNSGIDTLMGDAGDDTLRGESGNDTLRGESGNDTLRGGTGNDLLDGGDGLSDLADYSDAVSGVTVDLLVLGAQTVGGGLGVDTLLDLEGIIGSDHGDTLDGSSGNDVLSGGGGADGIEGAAGNDTLLGEAGDDTLRGEGGNDTLTGGAGNDYFVFADSGGDDFITDFNAAGADIIDLVSVSDITDFADLEANHMADSGADTTISYDGGNDVITIEGVNVADLDSADFNFSAF